MDRGVLELADAGLYCAAGDFYIDPWKPVARAVITHGHGDHARYGSDSYLCASPGLGILRTRLGATSTIEGIDYGECRRIGDANVTLFPAGHILGSAQVRVEVNGLTWVVSGDYKRAADSTCEPFEPVRCHGFVSEATFALPIYRWRSNTFQEINAWWQQNKSANLASVLYGYSLGKAQRLIAGVDADIGPIYTHGSIERLNEAYRAAGVSLPPTSYAMSAAAGSFAGSLIVAPPGMNGSTWLRRFGDLSTGMASGWMAVRGQRRRRAVDRGFTLSDHADWQQLLDTIRETKAETVWVTHGYIDPLVRYLKENGFDAQGLRTQFESNEEESESVQEERAAE